MSIINGYSYSRIHATGGTSEHNITINLPMTNLNGGNVETVQIRKIEEEFINFDFSNPTIETDQDILGYTIIWNLSFTDFITGNDLKNIELLYDLAKDGCDLRFTPRVDQPSRWFDVVIVTDSFDVGLHTGGDKSKYHRLFNIQFKTKNLESSLKWILVPEPSTVFGVDFDGMIWVGVV